MKNEKDVINQSDVLDLLLERENKSSQIEAVLESKNDAIIEFEG